VALGAVGLMPSASRPKIGQPPPAPQPRANRHLTPIPMFLA